MPDPGRDPYAALRHPGCRRFLTGTFLANVGRQGAIVAATWQIYQWTGSATALGLVGLVNVVPLLLFVLPAGALADRGDRRVILQGCMFVSAGLSLALAAVSFWHDALPRWPGLAAANGALRSIAWWFERHAEPESLQFSDPALPLVYLLLFLLATVRVLGNPSRGALLPQLVPPSQLSNAVTWSASSFELATVVGPALGGLVVATIGYSAVYVLDAVCALALAGALAGVRVPPRAGPRPAGPGALAGVRFIWSHPPILAALTLDLCAVVLGGVTALLPIYAGTILHIGPAGLGWLRAAPAVGAIAMAFVVTHLPPLRRPGVGTLWSVAAFGLCLVVFALSTHVWLSLAALFLSGVCDNFSVVVRHTLVQLLTPDALRGRVTSVNQLFIGSSNEISALRAGLTAAWLGPVLAATSGGVGTILVAVAVALCWPALRALPSLHSLTPAAPSGPGAARPS